ncbi:MAG TPA: DUF2905 domain-containing protein [Chlamydiales bacterium]|jgi:hypothetical protein
MIGRFFSFLIVFVVITGLILHFQAEVPMISSWIGQLPGDLIIKKEGLVIYLPITTSGILAALLAVVVSGFSKKSQS